MGLEFGNIGFDHECANNRCCSARTIRLFCVRDLHGDHCNPEAMQENTVALGKDGDLGDTALCYVDQTCRWKLPMEHKNFPWL
ncbi:hypothetical protein Pla52n_52670 [Stieleria varia]|uniref:Uncharacterized protein n=1 Tax=Stieleria varia TaxID=2528005 RepID=A0A5C6A4T1_9BACT|nr:hypothetical protein Pla52n_52670 [Stieleria varia]